MSDQPLIVPPPGPRVRHVCPFPQAADLPRYTLARCPDCLRWAYVTDAVGWPCWGGVSWLLTPRLWRRARAAERQEREQREERQPAPPHANPGRQT